MRVCGSSPKHRPANADERPGSGDDRAGEPRRTSEDIGRYLADQLIFYAALADGVSQYRILRLTEHVDLLLVTILSSFGFVTFRKKPTGVGGYHWCWHLFSSGGFLLVKFGKSEVAPRHRKS